MPLFRRYGMVCCAHLDGELVDLGEEGGVVGGDVARQGELAPLAVHLEHVEVPVPKHCHHERRGDGHPFREVRALSAVGIGEAVGLQFAVQERGAQIEEVQIVFQLGRMYD